MEVTRCRKNRKDSSTQNGHIYCIKNPLFAGTFPCDLSEYFDENENSDCDKSRYTCVQVRLRQERNECTVMFSPN